MKWYMPDKHGDSRFKSYTNYKKKDLNYFLKTLKVRKKNSIFVKTINNNKKTKNK